MKDLCNTKQRNGETFTVFLQRWRRLFSRYAYPIPKKERWKFLLITLMVK
jgi:hypothetical protein